MYIIISTIIIMDGLESTQVMITSHLVELLLWLNARYSLLSGQVK